MFTVVVKVTMNDRHEPLEYVYVFEKRLKVSVPYKPRRRVVREVAVICLQRPTPLALDDLSRFFATLLGKIPLALHCSAKIVPVATRRKREKFSLVTHHQAALTRNRTA